MNPAIFKAYDIRGRYPEELGEKTAFIIGQAIAVFSQAKTICVGKDVRISSPPLFHALTNGLLQQGVKIIDIGLCTTPQLYFATVTLATDLGIMITASHNPKEYNGFKICRNGAIPLSGPTGIFAIRDLCIQNTFVPAPRQGRIESYSIQETYEKHFSPFSQFPLRVVIDSANAVGVFEARILQKCCTVIPLFFELDGTFPNHAANPLEYETLYALQQKVLREKADLGIAFDGDADRISFIDEQGKLVANDLVTALLARFFPHETILFDVRSTAQIENEIQKVSGIPKRCRVGHAFIKQQMRELNAAFAGELSGHYYYRDHFFAESSLYTALLMLKLLQKENKPLSALVQSVQRFFQSGEINSLVKDTQQKMGEIERHYSLRAVAIDHLDGLTMKFEAWWFNLRPSNTEPLLRLNLEANSESLLQQKKEELLNQVRA